MDNETCPVCGMEEVLEHKTAWECATCGHEWERAAESTENESEGPRVVKDIHGNILQDGDIVQLIKDLPLRGSSQVLKAGLKTKPIRLVDGDHEISCKLDGQSVFLKACFVKKA